MTATQVMKQLEKLGTAPTRKTFLRHGCRAPFFGVKVADLKGLVKAIGKDRDSALAKELYQTGNADAQYLAGLLASGKDFKKAELEQWAKKASWHMISEYTVAWIAAESPAGWELALGWIDAKDDAISSAGWSTLAGVVSLRPDDELDLEAIEKLLERVRKTIHGAPNRTRYAMNGFVIAVGGAVLPLGPLALAAARAIGPVEVDMGDTSCKLPAAVSYIEKIAARGAQGKKKKTMKC